jgi:cation:H+ antiporter
MELFNSLVLFGLGFFVLIKGAQILVHGAVATANVFKVSTWFIGAVIVSIGTSIPEFSINVASVFGGNDVGIATILGSNIFNVLMVLGIMSIFSPIIMRRSWVLRDLLTFVFITAIACVAILFPLLGDSDVYGITRPEALLLLGIFLIWLIQMIRRWDEAHENLDFEVVTLFTASVYIVGGVIGVFVGGNWVVDGAVLISEIFGVSPATIGFTVVALGTSLPELAVSTVALAKKSYGIAVGNIVGSSVFNLLGVLGTTGLIREITVIEGSLAFDVSFVMFSALLWFVFMFIGKNYTLGRGEGAIFVVFYIVFIISLFSR